MSTRAKVTLITTIAFATLTVWGVHHMQESERETMYQGVIRDDARRLEKMKQREGELRESQRKRELYERVQSIRTADDLPS